MSVENKEFQAWYHRILYLAHERPILDATEFDRRVNYLINSLNISNDSNCTDPVRRTTDSGLPEDNHAAIARSGTLNQRN